MQERIYCSEQITIPNQLPQIIKEYSKVVLREQPSDLIEFSIKYFKQLSALRPNSVSHESFSPDLKLVSGMYRDLSDNVNLEAAVEKYLIPQPVHHSINSMLQMAHLEPDALTYTILLLSLAYSSMGKVVESVMAVTSPTHNGEIRATLLMQIVEVLSKFDPRVEVDVLEACTGWVKTLVQFEGDNPIVSYPMIVKAGFLGDKVGDK
ncbi:Hypothetical protein GLP15_3211 [Giardia lamblia P15]|uniref:RIIa domain-containing protein n=1 Tax=Giardia intestinalis (strain P15) TaxID=658858 RepID=E1EWT9_GIAIA|nr:Hypothetical protein GLP15_3211 [Giardia lamblia P15]